VPAMSNQLQAEVAPIAAVTGARGYVGRIVSRALAPVGFDVIGLVRRPAGSGDRFYDLRGDPDANLLDGVDTLIHCAYDFTATSEADVWAVNVVGTRRLLEAAAASGVRRTILVSSMSAYPGTDQLYGRAKLEAERTARGLGMAVVRLGLVYGPGWGGMAGSLKKMVGLPVVPIVGAKSYQYTVHEDDLAAAFVVLAQASKLPNVPLGLANPEPVPFRLLMERIASAAGRSRFRPILVPWRPLYAALWLGERTPVRLPFRADSLLGLVRPAPGVSGAEDVCGLGIRLRPFAL
jgi:nucleoside-diphosphate-sugar epimerase